MTNHRLTILQTGPSEYTLMLAHQRQTITEYLAVPVILTNDENNEPEAMPSTLWDCQATINRWNSGHLVAVDCLGNYHANEQLAAIAPGLFPVGA